MAIALLNAKISYSPDIHTSIAGGMAAIIGYNIFLLGTVADLTLAKRLKLQLHPITQKFLKLTPPKAIAIGILLILIGIAHFITLTLYWIESGYQLSLRRENAIDLALVALGIQLISSSFFLNHIESKT